MNEQTMRTIADEIAAVIFEHTDQDPEISVVGTVHRESMVISISSPAYRVDLIRAEEGTK